MLMWRRFLGDGTKPRRTPCSPTRVEGIVITVCVSCPGRPIPGAGAEQSGQLAGGAFTAMPSGCVRKTGKYARLTVFMEELEGQEKGMMGWETSDCSAMGTEKLNGGDE